MIQRLTVTNFRSLERVLKLEFDPGFTALVGANGSGKSAILKALDLVLGLSWPSLRGLRVPQDWTRFDDQQELAIKVRLREPLLHADKLGKQHHVAGFAITCKPYVRKTKRALPGDPNFDYHALDERGNVPQVCTAASKGSKPTFGPLLVSSELREQARALFIDHRRSIFQQQPWSRGSVLARLLGPARLELDRSEIADGVSHRQAFSERYQLAVEALRTPRVAEVEDIISATTNRTLGFLGSATTSRLNVGFGFADPANPLGSLRVIYREGDLELPAEELGLGVQSAIVVGIFDAFRQIGADIGTVLIEEPEMYLHPQAQRYFYGLLSELADSGTCQVICSTHSPVFADMTRFEGIRLVRRAPGESTALAWVKKRDDIAWLEERRSAQKLSAFNATRSEALFAQAVLLVEGPGDVLAVRTLASTRGVDLDREDLAVIECGSKSGIPFVARVCRALGIPVVAIHDTDIYPVPDDNDAPKVTQQNAEHEAINASIVDGVGDQAKVFSIAPSLEGVLGIGRNASDKPKKVADALTGMPVDDWPAALDDALTALVAALAHESVDLS